MDNQLDVASKLDSEDPLSRFRNGFAIPSMQDVGSTKVNQNQLKNPCLYLCGNSLGLMNQRSKRYIESELQRWSKLGVLGHFSPSDHGWVNQADAVSKLMAKLIGATPSETVCMSTLTANLHLLMNAFYAPTSKRHKILCEAHAFPSDQYAFASQVAGHGYDPKEAIIEMSPRNGELTLREEDILSTIETEGDSISLVLFSGIQYYTGQFFPIERITHAAHVKGCVVGWDLAHAVGNVPLSMHEWGADFAVWCSYKYLNAGAGAIGGLFVHSKWDGKELKRQAGWWGHTLSTRFEMPSEFSPITGAQGWQQSNPSMLGLAALQGSLEIFDEAGGMEPLRAKSLQLTGFLGKLLRESPFYIQMNPHLSGNRERTGFHIITCEPPDRGCQLSLLITGIEGTMERVFKGLRERGVIGDERRPNVIRLAPTPLYNNFEDCYRTAKALDETFCEL